MGIGTNEFSSAADSVEVKQYFCLATTAACTAATSSGYIDEVVKGTGNTSSPETFLWTVCSPDVGDSGCTPSTSSNIIPFISLPNYATNVTFLANITIVDGGANISIDLGNSFDQTPETPEPGTLLLLGSGLCVVMFAAKRRLL